MLVLQGVSVVVLVGALLPLAATPASASGTADCFDASGNSSYSQNSYTVSIRDRCGSVGSGDEDFGARIMYSIDMGFGGFCASTSGTVTRGSFGTSVSLDTSCLSPGNYRPQVKFQSFMDGSYNFVYLSTFSIREITTPSFAPPPTPLPSRPIPLVTPTPSPSASTIVPTPSPSAPNAGSTLSNHDNSFAPASAVDLRKTLRGTKVLNYSVGAAGLMTALVNTRLPQGKNAKLVTSSWDPVTKTWPERSRVLRVDERGRVRFEEPLTKFDYVWLKSRDGKMLARWTTT